MPTEQKYKCDQCGMIFPSHEALFKHKTRFCIGVKDSGIGREPVYSDDDEPRQHNGRSTHRKVIAHPSVRERVDLSTRRSPMSFDKPQQGFLPTTSDVGEHLLLQSHDLTYQEILLDYERLQAQERDILREMYSFNPQPSPAMNTSNTTDRLRSQLEDLQRRNARLEQERQLIQGKLEELITTNHQPTSLANSDPFRFLNQMKEQQELNDKAVSFLQQRLVYPYSSLVSKSNVPTLPDITSRSRRTGGSDDVRDFRHNYMISGGHDADTVARYTDIEYRLRAYEDYPWTKDYPEPLKPNRYQPGRSVDPTKDQLQMANDENFRLQTELEDIHHKVERLDTRTRQLEVSAANNSLDTTSMKTDFYPPSHSSVVNQPPERDYPRLSVRGTASLDKRVTPRESPAMSLLTSNMTKLRDPFAPQSYDPIGGFVIFFDFILRLPGPVEQCCLITCLHHPKSGLGEPSQLDIFKCTPYVDERHGEQMTVAMIAMKQPVPRCPPQQALTVVLELQTTSKKQRPTLEDLKTEAWIKLPLFDQKNRLLSGRWKVPLKALPIQHDESLAVISTLPSFAGAELHYRLVNSSDGEEQSNASLSPNIRDLYSYPLQFRH